MPQPIYCANWFFRTWKDLTRAQKERILDLVIELPNLLKNPHRHSGVGLRRIHGSGFVEARIDLRWRLIMKIDSQEIVLFDVMNHDQVRRLGK
jgi:mRNA-degrading endonuclease RelE of RelBE toxin-antitoxin system